MKLEKCINTTKNKVESRKHNIFIPVCLGNKFFLDKNKITQNIEEYINWSLERTRDKVLIFIVDEIQDTNYLVRNSRSSYKKALRRVLREGKKIEIQVNELIKSLSKKKQDKIDIIRWKDYEEKDVFSSRVTRLIYKEFINNNDFKKEVLNRVKTSVTDRKFKEKEYFKLCEYVLDEFSLVYSGVFYKDIYYDLYIYPNTDSVVDFLDKIQKREIFPDFHDKLPDRKVALAILN